MPDLKAVEQNDSPNCFDSPTTLRESTSLGAGGRVLLPCELAVSVVRIVCERARLPDPPLQQTPELSLAEFNCVMECWSSLELTA